MVNPISANSSYGIYDPNAMVCISDPNVSSQAPLASKPQPEPKGAPQPQQIAQENNIWRSALSLLQGDWGKKEVPFFKGGAVACTGGTETMPPQETLITTPDAGIQVVNTSTVGDAGAAGLDGGSTLQWVIDAGHAGETGAAGATGTGGTGGAAGLDGAAGEAGAASTIDAGPVANSDAATPIEEPNELLRNPIVNTFFADNRDGKWTGMTLRIRIQTANGQPISFSGLQERVMRLALGSNSTLLSGSLGTPTMSMPCSTGLIPTEAVNGVYPLTERFTPENMNSSRYKPFVPEQVYIQSVKYTDLRANPVAPVTENFVLEDASIVGSSCAIDPLVASKNPAVNFGPLNLVIPAEFYKTGTNAGIAYFDIDLTMTVRNVGMTYQPFAYNAIGSVTALTE